MEKRYSISDAAKQLSVETHVLRYWEEEIGLHISRNAQGHRYYMAGDIELLRSIKYLKVQGFQLKAIKLILSDIASIQKLEPSKLYHLRDELNQQVQADDTLSQQTSAHTAQVMPLHPNLQNYESTTINEQELQEQKLRHFEAMMRKMIRSTVEEMDRDSEERICEKISTRLLKEMDYLTRQKEDLQEQQIQLLHQILSEVQHQLPDTAASTENELKTLQSKRKEKSRLRRKKKFAKSNQ